MRFRPTKGELAEAISRDLATTATDLTDPGLYVSASNWDRRHLRALRVSVFENVDTWKLIPNKYIVQFYTKGKFHTIQNDSAVELTPVY